MKITKNVFYKLCGIVIICIINTTFSNFENELLNIASTNPTKSTPSHTVEVFHSVECSQFLFYSVKHCTDPGSVENGKKEGSPPFTCISSVKYTCNEGYWLLGSETLSCGIDGQWDHGKPVCIDKSKKPIEIDCDFDTELYSNNRLHKKSSLNLIQLKIYTQQNLFVVIQQGQGCGEPPRIDNAQRFGSSTEVTYECTECNTGGGRATCSDGEWTHNGNCASQSAH